MTNGVLIALISIPCQAQNETLSLPPETTLFNNTAFTVAVETHMAQEANMGRQVITGLVVTMGLLISACAMAVLICERLGPPKQ